MSRFSKKTAAQVAGEATPARPGIHTPRWIILTLAVFFGLFFAYDAWEGVGNLISFPRLVAELGGAVSAFGWVLLVLGLLMPILCFAASYLLGRRRGLLAIVLIYLAGLGTSAALTFTILQLAAG